MIENVVGVALAPLLIVQGRRAKRETLRLPEPPGERVGSGGTAPPLRLLILGDSAGAGVGAEHQDEALLGQTVRRLARRRRIDWRLQARTGARTLDVLDMLDALAPARFDVAITTMGVNDVTGGVTLPAWRRRQTTLRRRLREEFGVERQIACGLPPVRGFPALPQPLRWVLGRRALRFSEALERDVASEPDVSFVSLEFTDDVSLMARDGFHPGPGVYERWGRLTAEAID